MGWQMCNDEPYNRRKVSLPYFSTPFRWQIVSKQRNVKSINILSITVTCPLEFAPLLKLVWGVWSTMDLTHCHLHWKLMTTVYLVQQSWILRRIISQIACTSGGWPITYLCRLNLLILLEESQMGCLWIAQINESGDTPETESVSRQFISITSSFCE